MEQSEPDKKTNKLDNPSEEEDNSHSPYLAVIVCLVNFVFLLQVIYVYSCIDFSTDYYHGNGMEFQTPVEICSAMKHIVETDDFRLKCAPGRCLNIHKDTSFRFGNDLHAFLKAINIARYMGMKQIYMPNGYMTLEKSFKIGDIQVDVLNKREAKLQAKRCYTFWPYSVGLEGVPPPADVIEQQVKDVFYDQLGQYMRDLGDNVLVMHVRSGDIFGHGYIHGKYGQPPCGYYQSVMREKKWSKVLLFAEDTRNPCVNVLKKNGAEHTVLNLKQEIAIMMNATNFVIGRGTFARFIVKLSKVVKKVWTFADGKVLPVPSQRECEPEKGYKENVLRGWRNERWQWKWMLNSSCAYWTDMNTSIYSV